MSSKLVTVLTLSSVVTACGSGSSPTTATETSAAIDSIVTTYRGQTIESGPITIPSPEVLDVEARLIVHVPGESRLTVYVCVLETASSIGVGDCVSVSSTAAELQQRGDIVRLGISTFKTDGVPRTTSYVYVAVAEGAFPWIPGATPPPRPGDTFGGNRVLATMQVPRTVTFR